MESGKLQYIIKATFSLLNFILGYFNNDEVVKVEFS